MLDECDNDCSVDVEPDSPATAAVDENANVITPRKPVTDVVFPSVIMEGEDDESKVTETVVISDDSVDSSDAVLPNVNIEMMDSTQDVASDVQNLIEPVVISENSCDTEYLGSALIDINWPADLATVFGDVMDWIDSEGHDLEPGLGLGLPNSMADNEINEFREGVPVHQDLTSPVDEGSGRCTSYC